MKRLTEKEAINETNLELVNLLKSKNVDFTNRVTDGTKDQGMMEFYADVELKDNDDFETLTMYVFIDDETVDSLELDQIDWEKAIKEAEYELS